MPRCCLANLRQEGIATMAKEPWFKFYAADYLLDPDVDAVPREAEALLVRMWCICHREGSCPIDAETLARKTQCSQLYVSQFKPHCERFFELRDGKLYSRRMEEEKRRSEQARVNANKRYRKEAAMQPAVQMAVRRSDSDFDSGFGCRSVFVLEENARARETPPKRPTCEECGGHKQIHVAAHIPGPRLIPCPKCCRGQAQTMGASA